MEKRTILLCSAILLLALLPGIRHGLWISDEPQVAGICAEMAYGKDFVVPCLNGNPFLEKPPLYYVLGALSGTVLGIVLEKEIGVRSARLAFIKPRE